MSQHKGYNGGAKRKTPIERDGTCGSRDFSNEYRCQNKINGSSLSRSECGNDATLKLECRHTFCLTCATSYFESYVVRQFIKCPVCKYATRQDCIETIDWKKTKQPRQINYSAEGKGVSQGSAGQTKVLVHRLATDEKSKCRCGSSDIAIVLTCDHRYCSACFVGHHKPLAILEEYCCIRCFCCEQDRWYLHDELKKKVEKNGERLYNQTSTSAGIQSKEVDCCLRDKEFTITWKSLRYSTESFVITVWTNINEKPDRKVAVQRKKDGSYGYVCNISTGVYFFRLAVNNVNDTDRFPRWIGPVDKQKALPPTVDSEIRTYTIDTNSVNVSWNPAICPKFVKIEEYVIEGRVGIGEWEEYKKVKDPQTSCKITNLKHNTNYYFRVKVLSSVGYGQGECTVEKICIKSEDKVLLAPPADVQICHNIPYYNEERISWRQCGWDERSRALSYVVYMRESDSKDWRKVTEEHVHRDNWFCILCPFKDMKDHTLYTFKIVARNEKGESEPVETEQLMKKSSPLPPNELDVTINGEMSYVLASWKPPTSDGGLPLQRYNIEIRSESDKTVVQEDAVHYTRTKMDIDISSLPAMTYELRLTAENIMGKSKTISKPFKIEKKKKEEMTEDTYKVQMTAEKKIGTNDKYTNTCKAEEKMETVMIDKPKIPTTIKVNQDTSTSISIKWYIDNIKEHQPVTDFVIESRKHGQTNYEIVKTTPLIPDENWQTCTVTGLTENTEYYFRVKARNNEGESEGICSDKIVMKKEEHVTDVADAHFEKDQVKEENDTPFCHGCEYQKALATRLTCLHQFCEECSIKLFENALDSENGLEIIFYWKCNVTECGGFTDEKGVKFLAGNFLSQTWLEEKQKQRLQEKQNSPETEKEDYYDNVLAKNSDMSIIRGLPNVGMSCYANCIFQILGQTPYLMDHLNTLIKQHTLDKDKSISGQLVILLQDINGLADDGFKRRVGFDSVARLVDTICAKDESFIRGEQADSHSFMITLFNAIKEETQNKEDTKKSETAPAKLKNYNDKQTTRKEASKTVTGGEEKSSKVAEPMAMFEGYMCNAFTFQGCSHEETSEPQMFNSILIPVKEGEKWSLNDGLKMVMKKEEYPIEELPCGECEKLNKGLFGRNKTTKQQYFATLPEILILQLGKFRQVDSSLTKMYKKVTYPYTLNMKEKQEKGKKACDIKYNLYGVALHIGTLQDGGHYAAYVKRHESRNDGNGTDLWYYCSDSVVKTVSKEYVMDDLKACILFYRRES